VASVPIKTEHERGVDGQRPGQRLSRATMIVVGIDGPALAKTITFERRALSAADVLALAELSKGARDIDELAHEVASRCGTSADEILSLAAELDERGLLVPADDLVPAPTGAQAVDALAADADPDPDHAHVMPVPTVFRIHAGSFEHRWHDGTLALALSPAELVAAASWREPSSPDDAFDRFTLEQRGEALDRSAFDALARRMQAVGLLDVFDPDTADTGSYADELHESIRRNMRITHATKMAVEAHAAERAEVPGGEHRVPVIPIHDNWIIPPLSLGLIVAYAKVYDDGALERSYDFVPRWLVDPGQVPEITTRPGVFLFSNYIWNHVPNLALAAQIKQQSPTSITIHGGPDTPKYEGDVARYFRDNPHVDITVRGEGEATFAELLTALAGHVGDTPADLSVLEDVAGISFRLGDRVVTTPDRDRITDLDTIPSPFLTGLFDSFAAGPARAAMIETNRGCPYGCTFCDWGSATLSRIRQFDLDRVLAEIEWCASRGFESISLCDANFGIFERDIIIAEKFAECRRTYGFPHQVGNNYAKNTVKHLKKIIKIFADAGIVAEGIVSLQSMDTETLQVIRRKNIKVEKYTELAAEFGANRLPLAVDLMMALPGSTTQSYLNDLQECANRDVRVRIHPTTMLPNSPMNEPSYRAEHGLVAMPGEVVKQSSTFDEDDWNYMWELRRVYLMCDLFAALRHVARFARSETGVQEVAFYDRLMRDVYAEPDRWPAMHFTFQSVPDLMVPPCSWSLYIDDVRDYLTSVLGIADDSSLETVLAVQLAHLPARDRKQFPEVLQLAHDHEAWHRARVAEVDAGHREDWEQRVPALRTFGPGTLTVDDPENICSMAMGGDLILFSLHLMAWDLDSPVARPRTTIDEQRHRVDPSATDEAAVVVDEPEAVVEPGPVAEPAGGGTAVAIAPTKPRVSTETEAPSTPVPTPDPAPASTTATATAKVSRLLGRLRK
jgi:radical SAM superfamily enzyme YgiQ (UPF0313 family)